jgi:hypothetical protein
MAPLATYFLEHAFVTRIAAQTVDQRIDQEAERSGVMIIIGNSQPLEGLVRFAAPSVTSAIWYANKFLSLATISASTVCQPCVSPQLSSKKSCHLQPLYRMVFSVKGVPGTLQGGGGHSRRPERDWKSDYDP